ncbi:MAG: hypothetical protein HYS13_15050 [Planctomycetia bacterium]|nr:hypothetical protein [Planctomycetia bacterium]
MRARSSLVIVLLLFAAALTVAAVPLWAQPQKSAPPPAGTIPAPPPAPGTTRPVRPAHEVYFDGKFFDVILKTPTITEAGSYTHYPMEKISLRHLGDEWFLVGQGVDTAGMASWYGAATVWIALSDVSGMHEFPTLEKLKAPYSQEGDRPSP